MRCAVTCFNYKTDIRPDKRPLLCWSTSVGSWDPSYCHSMVMVKMGGKCLSVGSYHETRQHGLVWSLRTKRNSSIDKCRFPKSRVCV